MIRSIYWENGTVFLLDQTRLPVEVRYLECHDAGMVAEAIRSLRVRGAPAIGIAAAMGLALAGQQIDAPSTRKAIQMLEPVREMLLSTRPTAVNLRWALDRVFRNVGSREFSSVSELKRALIGEAQALLDEDVAINRAIGEVGAFFVPDRAAILTHCNAGALATGGYGTATAVMRVARERGKTIRVFADETRPVLQGARLTAYELLADGFDVTLLADAAAGSLLKSGAIDLVVVGTDRTTRNGDVANKIGTYPLAVLCKENGVPFYVAAPLSSIDFSMESGDEIPIEMRAPEEVRTILGRCTIAPEGVKVHNPAFDVTPARYVTAVFTEIGAFRPADLYRLAEPDADPASFRLDRPAGRP